MEMSICTMANRMGMMMILISILVAMAIVMMLQQPTNNMGLASKKMGKISIFFLSFISGSLQDIAHDHSHISIECAFSRHAPRLHSLHLVDQDGLGNRLDDALYGKLLGELGEIWVGGEE